MAIKHSKRRRGRPSNPVPQERVHFTISVSVMDALREKARNEARSLSAQAELAIVKGL